jgi:trans-2,3-dihydro-3-hydroxyanthranilate isomerase
MTTSHSLPALDYYQVDVFTHEALAGNGLSVFLPESPLPARAMQRLAVEMRQFESIFLTPDGPGSRFEARIFTMEEELDFAGHPCWARRACCTTCMPPGSPPPTGP